MGYILYVQIDWLARTEQKQKMRDEKIFFFAYTNTETPKMLNDFVW